MSKRPETYGQYIQKLMRRKENVGLQISTLAMSIAGIMVVLAKDLLAKNGYRVAIGDEVVQEQDEGHQNPSWEDVAKVLLGGDFMRNLSVHTSLTDFLCWLYDKPLPEEDDLWDLLYPQNMFNLWNERAMEKNA